MVGMVMVSCSCFLMATGCGMLLTSIPNPGSAKTCQIQDSIYTPVFQL